MTIEPGAKVGNLTLLRPTEPQWWERSKHERPTSVYWHCVCDCGQRVTRLEKAIRDSIDKEHVPTCSLTCPIRVERTRLRVTGSRI